ncbi:hypothetical protein GALL_213680 [mine drainage metagenome]|uniref:RloB-like protein n=1 Tax=mine drainage metagenome TaxID=410659 RepID=A0A1J5RLR5_9ZZZZ
MSQQRMPAWKAQRTLLLVGEGRHEEAFLYHVKHLYIQRGCGLAVTIKHAGGKGAKHVIDWTVRQIANVAYDSVAAMLDTDVDWSPVVAKRAKAKKIHVLASEPCFEAILLRLIGQHPVGDANDLKRLLAPYLNDDPTRRENYRAHFGKSCLEAGRQQERAIDDLLKLLGA